jgi:hypothetical protein
MSQASWNLCPQKIQYDSSCYYSDDVTFDSISGSSHVTLPDVPDGVWALRVKRDLLSKIQGAVRSTQGVERAAVWFKVRGRAWGAGAGNNKPQEVKRGTSTGQRPVATMCHCEWACMLVHA